MTLILAGRLATTLLRAGATEDESIPADRCNHLLESSRPTQRNLAGVRMSLGSGSARRHLERMGLIARDEFQSGNYEDNIDLVCPRHGNVTRTSSLRVHYCSIPLIDGSFQRVAPELGLGPETYVVAPALELVLESKRLGFGGIVTMGMELCGTYSPDESNAGRCLYDVPTAATFVELSRGLKALARRSKDSHDRTRGAAGVGRCLSALPFILENSASPMESVVAATLSIPSSRGGWGIEGLELNARVNLDEEEARIAGQPFIKPDGLVARANVGYEYDSRQFHRDERQRLRDQLRITSAQFGGIRLLPLTWDVVRDEGRFAAFCAEFAKLTGKRLKPPNDQTSLRRQELRREFALPLNKNTLRRGYDNLVPLDVYERDDPWLVA